MYIRTIQPFVKFCVAAPYEGDPTLEARGWLVCPHCRGVREVSTRQINLHVDWDFADSQYHIRRVDYDEKRLGSLIYEIMTPFKQNYICEFCGTVSAAPQSDQQKVQKELRRLVTAEWITRQIRSLIMNPQWLHLIAGQRGARSRADARRTYEKVGLQIPKQLSEMATQPIVIIDDEATARSEDSESVEATEQGQPPTAD